MSLFMITFSFYAKYRTSLCDFHSVAPIALLAGKSQLATEKPNDEKIQEEAY